MPASVLLPTAEAAAVSLASLAGCCSSSCPKRRRTGPGRVSALAATAPGGRRWSAATRRICTPAAAQRPVGPVRNSAAVAAASVSSAPSAASDTLCLREPEPETEAAPAAARGATLLPLVPSSGCARPAATLASTAGPTSSARASSGAVTAASSNAWRLRAKRDDAAPAPMATASARKPHAFSCAAAWASQGCAAAAGVKAYR